MKKLTSTNMILIIIIVALSILVLYLKKEVQKLTSDREYITKGYTGELKDADAIKLREMCHFIPKSYSDSFIIRFKALKDSINSGQKVSLNNRLLDSCSFNSFIVRRILSDSNNIGLRIITGLDSNLKFHAILAGIDRNYRTLYIDEPEDGPCSDGRKKMELKTIGGPGGKVSGAAEMAPGP